MKVGRKLLSSDHVREQLFVQWLAVFDYTYVVIRMQRTHFYSRFHIFFRSYFNLALIYIYTIVQNRILFKDGNVLKILKSFSWNNSLSNKLRVFRKLHRITVFYSPANFFCALIQTFRRPDVCIKQSQIVRILMYVCLFNHELFD